MAERTRTLAAMCIRKASIKTVISTVAASRVAISDPLVPWSWIHAASGMVMVGQ
jgi:hypothetical protein